MDGEGGADVVPSTNRDDRLVVLLNDGDGALVAGASIEGGAYFVELEDLDGDGDIDIAMDTPSLGDALESSFVILLNDGSGNSFARTDHPLGAKPQEIALADIDSDGDLDFLAARSPSRASGRPQDVAVFRNDGNGQFDQAPSLHPGHKPNLLRTADLDGDGDTDVLSVSDGLYADRESLAIFLNQGTGIFPPPVLHTVGDEPAQVEIRDLNGDARPEILVLNYFGLSLSVLKNAGSGVFDAPV